MNYLDFDLEVRALSGTRCRVTVRSPQGDHEGEAELPASLEALGSERARLYGEALRTAEGARGEGVGAESGFPAGVEGRGGDADGGRGARDLRPEAGLGGEAGELGRALYDALFQGRVAELFAASSAHASLLGRGVRIKLVTLDASLALVPWEVLCPRRGDSLCLSATTPIVRHVLVARPQISLRVEPPLRVLGVLSSGGGGPLDLARERAGVDAELGPLCKGGLAEIEWLEAPTGPELLAALDRKEWHVLHFAGHGAFDRGSSQGLLSIASGGRNHLRASELRVLLRDRPSLRLVFLNSCEGAVGDARELFSSTAALVVEAGVPAVLAMQFPISDGVAARFARRVYKQIAAGAPLEKAVAEARKDIYVGGSLEWATPVLFMRSAEGALLRAGPGEGALAGASAVAGAALAAPSTPALSTPAPWAEGARAPTPRPGATPVSGPALARAGLAAKGRLSSKIVLACLSVGGVGVAKGLYDSGPTTLALVGEAVGRGKAPTSRRGSVTALRWGGTDCEGKPAEVALGACHERRSLGWLAGELRALIVSGKLTVLPEYGLLGDTSFKLVANSFAPNEAERSKYIFVCAQAASYDACVKSDYYLTIGWHGDALPPDGAVRVYKKGASVVLGPLYYCAGGPWCSDQEGATRL